MWQPGGAPGTLQILNTVYGIRYNRTHVLNTAITLQKPYKVLYVD